MSVGVSFRFARLLWIAPFAALAACVSAPTQTPRRVTGIQPAQVRTALGFTPEPSPTTLQCMADLDKAEVRYASLPDQDFGGGCSAINSVRLLDIGTPVTNLGAMTCPLAQRFAAWARYGVQPAARLILGSPIARIETFGTYNCRPIAGSAKLSQHAHSNAVDVSAFILTDGRRISVRSDWTEGGDEARFLRVVHDSACKRFSTVLSPDYNSDHTDHLHFDMSGVNKGFCR